jgi:hypothetical protein
MTFVSNPELDLAFDYVRNTNRNIFLTGRAGTGKTTFLNRIKEEGWKRIAVTAPTGVAAINAGGMTLHSLFQLPFGLHLPGASRDANSTRRFSRDKISLIRSLELLVIDEISMVRADLLDAVDDVLRRYRDQAKPFGGVQLLMIGDLYQLPPVVKQEDWELLRHHYQTPYFFGSLVLQKTDMVVLELKQIFRQTDGRFIELLNKVRDNRIDAGVLEMLNSRYIADFQPGAKDAFITLTSHNASASELNYRRLESIGGRLHTFKATIEGDFPEMAYPTEETLEFKKGAQVMFVKNDTSEEKRFFNGKIGEITGFRGDEISVRCKDEPDEITVPPAEWHNIRYSLDEETKEVKEDLLGTFTQYPLKLAWAITIHKSQGLTFDRAIIDARSAFAHGQVYVALSRCKTFAGIVLSSKIGMSSVKTDWAVKRYGEETERRAPSEADLRQAKREYQAELVRELFGFRAMKRSVEQLNKLFLEHGNALSADGMSHFRRLAAKADAEVFSIAGKFLPQLEGYLSQPDLPEENENLRQRLQKAGSYFSSKLEGELLPEVRNINLVTDDQAVVKTAREHLTSLQQEMLSKLACFTTCRSGFSTNSLVRAKTNAELDAVAKRSAPKASPGVPKDVQHPDLYARLLRWRNDTAEEFDLEPYSVLPTRSLQELVQRLPTDRASLKGIKGIGRAKVKRFGASIIGMIKNYCVEKNLLADPPKSPAPTPASSKLDTKRVSLDLYKSGRTIDQIAAERNLKPGTIEGHLAYFIARGDLDALRFLTQEQLVEITGFFAQNGGVSTSEAKAHFGDKYSYGELTIALAYSERRRGRPGLSS